MKVDEVRFFGLIAFLGIITGTVVGMGISLRHIESNVQHIAASCVRSDSVLVHIPKEK